MLNNVKVLTVLCTNYVKKLFPTLSSQGRVDDFGALLRETDVSPSEQDQVINGIEEALHTLEADYLQAIEQHADELQRASIATGGAISSLQEFDPDRSIEDEIVT